MMPISKHVFLYDIYWALSDVDFYLAEANMKPVLQTSVICLRQYVLQLIIGNAEVT